MVTSASLKFRQILDPTLYVVFADNFHRVTATSDDEDIIVLDSTCVPKT